MPEHFLCKIIFFKETWSECFWEHSLMDEPEFEVLGLSLISFFPDFLWPT